MTRRWLFSALLFVGCAEELPRGGGATAPIQQGAGASERGDDFDGDRRSDGGDEDPWGDDDGTIPPGLDGESGMLIPLYDCVSKEEGSNAVEEAGALKIGEGFVVECTSDRINLGKDVRMCVLDDDGQPWRLHWTFKDYLAGVVKQDGSEGVVASYKVNQVGSKWVMVARKRSGPQVTIDAPATYVEVWGPVTKYERGTLADCNLASDDREYLDR